jgi:glutamate-1-semialdehyde 2,1-aminomutase
MPTGANRYDASLAQLERAEAVIPLGAQTVSKSRLTLPAGIAPLYGSRAEGCRITDLDGHEYVDAPIALIGETEDVAERAEEEALLDLYMQALGEI